MIVRQFNQAGIEAFRKFLAVYRPDGMGAVPRDMLEDNALTAVVTPQIEIEPQSFMVKSEAAHYLRDRLAPLGERDVATNADLWTWLTLFYFDEVCPVRGGKRAVKNDYTYIFEPENPRHFYRHLLFIAWRVLQVAPKHNRLFLGSPLSSLDKVTGEVMKRLYLTRIPCIFEVLDRLYWDNGRGRARIGIVDERNVKPGDLRHRFPIRIRQLEMTHDLQSLTADQLIELLGVEFQRSGAPQNALTA